MSETNPQGANPKKIHKITQNTSENIVQDNQWEILRYRITKELSEQFDNRLKEDRTFIKTILGWALGIVSIVFLILGVKTLNDMNEYIKSMVHETISRKLNYEDPRSLSSLETEHIFVRAIVNSYALVREKARVVEEPIEMEIRDFNRLLSWIKNENSLDDEFENIIYLIENSQQYFDESHNEIKGSSFIYNALGGMLSPDFLQKSYLKDRPDRQALLIQSICRMNKKSPQLLNLLMDILNKPDCEERLRSAAIYGIGRLGNKEHETLLTSLAEKSGEAVKQEILKALASINPDADYIKKWVGEFREVDGFGDLKPHFVIDFATTLYDNLFRKHQSPKLDNLRTALLLFSACIDKGIRFNALSNPWGDELIVKDIRGLGEMKVGDDFDLLANEGGVAPIRTIYLLMDTLQFEMNECKSTDTLNRQISLIEKYTILNRRNFDSMFQENQENLMLVKLAKGSTIQIKGGPNLTKDNTHPDVPIKLKISEDKQILATWWNQNGTVMDYGTINAIMHPEKMSFGYRFRRPSEKTNILRLNSAIFDVIDEIHPKSMADYYLFSHGTESSKE